MRWENEGMASFSHLIKAVYKLLLWAKQYITGDVVINKIDTLYTFKKNVASEKRDMKQMSTNYIYHFKYAKSTWLETV